MDDRIAAFPGRQLVLSSFLRDVEEGKEPEHVLCLLGEANAYALMIGEVLDMGAIAFINIKSLH